LSASDSSSTAWWQRVFDAADHALGLDPAERAAFLAQCATTDPELGDEVRAILASGEGPSPLDHPAASFAATIFEQPNSTENRSTHPQSWFGPYRVLRELGQGGMGMVYLAERSDDQYQKRVALKVLPAWSARDERKLQRFIEERQILAALDHPGIAGLLDGGITPDGVPWFVMEYVEGVQIDRYCDDHRLAIGERLALFAEVCIAVQYAHRNLVVHRDLKPANILVTADGRVRLLDFGIAKLLDHQAAAEVTVVGDRILTPLYASPEQLGGKAITTASDVYSLGVLLNVLLTGRYPYKLTSWEHYDVARSTFEQEPLRPSLSVTDGAITQKEMTAEQLAAARDTTPPKLKRVLDGDLDAIVGKALAKEPGMRYGTAEQLEADVQRYLAGLPILARPESRLYHLRKFARRHRAGVVMTAAAAVFIITFAAVMTVQRSRIKTQAERIAVERDRAEQVNRFLMATFQSLDPNAADHGITAREILDLAASRIDQPQFARPEDRAELMYKMGEAYHHLNYSDRARDLLERSLALRRSAIPKRDVDVAQTLHLLGEVLAAQKQFGSAEKAFEEALILRRRAPQLAQQDIARTLTRLALVMRTQRRLPEAESAAREAVRIDQGRSGDVRLDLAQSKSALADVLFAKGDAPAAAQLYRQALVLLRGQRPEEHADVARGVFGLAAALRGVGDDVAADSLQQYGHGLYQRLLLASEFRAKAQAPVPGITVDALDSTLPSELGSAAQTTLSLSSKSSVSHSSLIAFSTDRHGPDPTGNLGNVEIYVMNPDGSGQRRLTRNDGADDNPAWSPDGKRIAFTGRRGAAVDIYVMNADGTEQRRLTNQEESAVGFNRPAWSRDGKRLVFNSLVRPDIYVINIDGTSLTNITNHEASEQGAEWSPDGRRIAFASDRDGQFQIYTMNPDGRDVVRLTFNGGKDQRPTWSPDGRRIAFHSIRDGDLEIYVMNADGSNEIRLTSNTGDDGHPTWSPDGAEIAFHRRVLGHGQIHVMKADGSGVRRITELSPVAYSGFPRWGPRKR
jgi:eukaryotic-like serine/threonine-protein kinase